MSKRKASTAEDGLYFLPLGGSGEIGMNLNLYGIGPEDNRKWLMIDLGVTFGNDSTPGVDLIMADPSFIEERADDLVGIVLTHAHEDHIGAVAHLWTAFECPVYATPFTAALVRGKLEEAGLKNEVPLHEIPLGGELDLDPFKLKFITLTHSIPEPNAIAIETRFGTVLHTGDWKIDPNPLIGEPTDEASLRALGDANVLAMVCDSTNVFEPGRAGSEGDVRENLQTLIEPLTGRVAVTTFASNVARVRSVIEVAAACGRHPVLVGRSMHKVVAAAKACGLLDGLPKLMDEAEAANLPRNKVLYICTGSQGEPRAALSRIARSDHRHIKLEEGDDVIFSSRVIPGNDLGIAALQNDLAALGVTVIQDRRDGYHVSGHPCRDELTDMYSWVRPKIAIPVHGELRHMKAHIALAKELQVPETVLVQNGTMVRLEEGNARIVDEVHNGRLYLDGDMLIESKDDVMRARKQISCHGIVTVTVVLDAKGRLAAEPAINVEGVPSEDWDGRPIKDVINHALHATIKRAKGKDREGRAFTEKLRIAARRSVREGVGKNPVTRVQVIEL